MADETVSLEFMRWLVAQRSRNQMSCMALFELLENHSDKWTKKKNFYASQALVGAAFSLWRAVFLGDKDGMKGTAFKHSKEFLSKVILDNAITYPIDKKHNGWTFNYYVENARLRLEKLASDWPSIVPKWKVQSRKPMPRWEYAQGLLDVAIRNFDKHLAKQK